jgi:predicted phosphodiesterase
MKIAYCSDLHKEWEPLILPDDVERADVLILAGDILNIKMFIEEIRIGEDNIHSFFEFISIRFKHIIMVVGNHEFYGSDINDAVLDLKVLLKGFKNVHVLDGETLVIDNVLFVGGTLWTDYNNEDPATLSIASRLIADYRRIYDRTSLVRPAAILERHKNFVKWAERVDKSGYDNVILVTHHSPSYQTVEDLYKDEFIMNGLFGSDLDKMLGMFDYAFFGHQHNPKTPVINGCKLLNNSRGYPFEAHSLNFKLKYIDI